MPAAEARVPPLVGSTAAARILGIPGPHVARLRKAGRLQPVPIEGTADAYVRSEVEALDRALKRERQARAKGHK
jgi:hypothetical protein